jgi:protein required for attachment to host cells
MRLYGKCLVLVADGQKARLFEERRRAGPLLEITARLGDLSSHGPEASAHAGRVHDRRGAGSHTTGGPSPTEKRELGFIRRLAERIDVIASGDGFDDLVVMAAPRALGQLRQALSSGTIRRLSVSEAHDRVACRPEEVQAALHALRFRPTPAD